ncbi:PilZ domain-containing protein [Candidatus Formimonas warabiya]|uniref:PilZ domain-containing protein n=1 Tax=Formimonas warabiya TaxID=1761012 RepID=A0A3G1KYA4_FORW1|nr:PilZ domain-containing protein [Candidatus Formimonas warabiya]ATW27458.1 hypothetical protein DCMF_24315 [Candidatus Formimonas warabiya]
MDTNEEKRRIARAGYRIKGQAKYRDKFFKGEIINFSLTGFLFSSDAVIDVCEGEKLIILFQWDQEIRDMVSEITCTVIRKVKNILGLKFDVIDYDTLMYLKEKLIDITGDENKINDAFIQFIIGNKG